MECLQYGDGFSGFLIETIVLNLVISGMPSILPPKTCYTKDQLEVLNLVISGMPSIQNKHDAAKTWKKQF